MVTASDLLREARLRTGMRQREIAELLHTTPAAVSLAEKRGDRMTIRRVREHLAVMGFDLYLMVKARDDA